MTPEQEQLLRGFVVTAEQERRDGYTMKRLQNTVDTLATRVLTMHQEIGALQRWRREFRRWWEAQSRHNVRDPMPTLSPDDSGSIEVGAFGAKAKFAGKGPIRLAAVIFVVAALVFAGYMTHELVHPHAAQAAASQKGPA